MDSYEVIMLYKKIIDSKKFNLKDILNCINSDTMEYHWAIFEFNGILLSKSQYDINQISDLAMKNKLGFQIEQNQLFELALDVEQTYDLILVGNGNYIKEFKNGDAWRRENDLVIEMVDCGDWEFYSTDRQLILKLESQIRV